MGPETKKRDNDRTNKQKSFISLSAVKTELPSDKINNNKTRNETDLKIEK